MNPRQAAGRVARAALRPLGFDLVRREAGPPPEPELPHDYDDFTRATWQAVRPYTLTTHERVAALVAAVRYVVDAGIEGDFVECGVWRGGSALTIARTLLDLGVTDRGLWLYDTFWIDMPPPSEHDRDIFGNDAETLLAEAHASGLYVNGTADQVRALVLGAGFPEAHLHVVEGLVEDTIPDRVPEAIALCRLDTDFYESTAHEVAHLVPRIPEGGVVLVDDYGHFVGCAKAVDEYLAAVGGGALLQRIDFTGRLLLLTADLHRRVAAHAAGGAGTP